MIKKTIIFTIFLLLFWNFFVKYNSFSLSQHQWQENIISAEKFIFDIDSIDNLIVGSSLARRLQMDSLPNFYNLSLGGQSILDGLNILRNKKDLPKNVFIEINVLVRSENLNFKEIISSPILNTLKENSLILRTDKQPLAYIGKRFISPLTNMFFKKIIYRVSGKIQIQGDKSENSIFNKMLAIQKDSYSKIDSLKMNKQFEILKNHINFLESKKVKIIFFEMPVNPQLIELTRAKYLRKRVKKEYYNNDFIKLPHKIETYETRDGVHLTSEESKRYTSYFKNKAITVTKTVYN